jgi:hypothetical protein
MFNLLHPATHQELLKKLLKKSKAAIFPFSEQPAVTKEQGREESKEITAIDLFSMFTADIIKEEVLFIR